METVVPHFVMNDFNVKCPQIALLSDDNEEANVVAILTRLKEKFNFFINIKLRQSKPSNIDKILPTCKFSNFANIVSQLPAQLETFRNREKKEDEENTEDDVVAVVVDKQIYQSPNYKHELKVLLTNAHHHNVSYFVQLQERHSPCELIPIDLLIWKVSREDTLTKLSAFQIFKTMFGKRIITQDKFDRICDAMNGLLLVRANNKAHWISASGLLQQVQTAPSLGKQEQQAALSAFLHKRVATVHFWQEEHQDQYEFAQEVTPPKPTKKRKKFQEIERKEEEKLLKTTKKRKKFQEIADE